MTHFRSSASYGKRQKYIISPAPSLPQPPSRCTPPETLKFSPSAKTNPPRLSHTPPAWPVWRKNTTGLKQKRPWIARVFACLYQLILLQIRQKPLMRNPAIIIANLPIPFRRGDENQRGFIPCVHTALKGFTPLEQSPAFIPAPASFLSFGQCLSGRHRLLAGTTLHHVENLSYHAAGLAVIPSPLGLDPGAFRPHPARNAGGGFQWPAAFLASWSLVHGFLREQLGPALFMVGRSPTMKRGGQ